MEQKIQLLWRKICTGMSCIYISEYITWSSSKFKWTTAIKVQFNKASTLLMVSGVLKVTINKARMGEIIVYECQGEDAGDVRSRISLK